MTASRNSLLQSLALPVKAVFAREEGPPEPVRGVNGRVLGVGSYPDVTAFAPSEKNCAIEDVVAQDETAAAHVDDLGDQVELVVTCYRSKLVANQVNDRCCPSLLQQR